MQRGIKTFDYGVVFGANEYYYYMNKFGQNPSCGTSFEDVWDGAAVSGAETMTLQTSAVTCGISSDDVDDTSAGAGARTVKIWGIDGDWVYQNETVTMDGQTKVETTKQYLMIYRGRVMSTGASLTNEGNIYVYDTASGVVGGIPSEATDLMAMITADKGQTLMSHFPIGAGYKGYVDHWTASNGDLQARFYDVELMHKDFGEAWHVHESQGSSDYFDRMWGRPQELNEKSIIKVRADCSAAMQIHTSLDILLVDENRFATRQDI
jgi:hypothetical protein